MFKIVDPQKQSIRSFKTHKTFKVTNNDSASFGNFVVRAISGSSHNYSTGSDTITHIVSGSISSSYAALPTYHMVKSTYYTDPNDSIYDHKNINKKLQEKANVFSIPRGLFGEEIKPGSIKLSDTSNSITFDIRDDKHGNLYDYAYSSSYAAFKSRSWVISKWTAQGSGSVVGNVFYDTGMIVITDTGSYKDVGQGTGTDGFEIDYRSTHTIYQHEYTVIADPGQFNTSRNVSLTYQRSGSVTVVEGAEPRYYFPPGDNPNPAAGSGSFSSTYQATEFAESFTTHSQFAPYITQIGLYNDNNELLVVGKTSRPIKNDPEMDMSFTLRFDV